MIQAYYFDGLHASMKPVAVSISDDDIVLTGEDILKRIARKAAHLPEMFERAPAYLMFPDGSHCEVSGDENKQNLKQMLCYRQGRVERWQSSWHVALLAILVMAAMLVAGNRWLIPRIADHAVQWIPVLTERQLGGAVMMRLDGSMMRPSQLSDLQIAQCEQALKRVIPRQSLFPIHLEVRDGKNIGPNAFALPGGTVVVTDQMVSLLLEGHDNNVTGVAADRLSAVLAHEVGHIQHRHGMQSLLSDSMLTIMLASLFGDFSSVLVAAPGLLMRAEYSRNKESEADAYAISRLRETGISPVRLADVFERLEKLKAGKNTSQPSWLNDAADFMSSHPPSKERLERFRAASQP